MFEKLKNFINNATVVTNGYETVKSKYGEMYVHEPTKKGLERIYDFRRKIIVNREEDKMGKINKMPDVAKILGKELEEEFGIKERIGNYKLTEKGLVYNSPCGWKLSSVKTLIKLLTGELKIEWIPKDGENVWLVIIGIEKPYEKQFHANFSGDIWTLKRGFVFKSEEEATAKMKELGWL